MITISIKIEEENMVAIMDGRLDTPSTPDAENISSSGLRLLLEILKNSKAHGHRVYMKDISNTIREAFTLTGFIDLFEYL